MCPLKPTPPHQRSPTWLRVDIAQTKYTLDHMLSANIFWTIYHHQIYSGKYIIGKSTHPALLTIPHSPLSPVFSLINLPVNIWLEIFYQILCLIYGTKYLIKYSVIHQSARKNIILNCGETFKMFVTHVLCCQDICHISCTLLSPSIPPLLWHQVESPDTRETLWTCSKHNSLKLMFLLL